MQAPLVGTDEAADKALGSDGGPRLVRARKSARASYWVIMLIAFYSSTNYSMVVRCGRARACAFARLCACACVLVRLCACRPACVPACLDARARAYAHAHALACACPRHTPHLLTDHPRVFAIHRRVGTLCEEHNGVRAGPTPTRICTELGTYDLGSPASVFLHFVGRRCVGAGPHVVFLLGRTNRLVRSDWRCDSISPTPASATRLVKHRHTYSAPLPY